MSADRLPPVLDTNIISELLPPRGDATVRSRFEALAKDHRPTITVVTLYELLRGLRKLELQGQGVRKRRALKLLLAELALLDPGGAHPSGWEIAADFWAAGQLCRPSVQLSEGDLLILSTAHAHGRSLATVDGRLAANAASMASEAQVELWRRSEA